MSDNILHELGKLCGLDPHAECYNRTDYRCVPCRARDEIQRLTRERDDVCDELEALLAEMGCASRTIESLSNKVAEAFDSMNWRGYVTNILQPNSSEDISRGRAADLIGELKKKSCHVFRAERDNQQGTCYSLLTIKKQREENERLREQLATELAECRRLLQFVRDSAVRDAGNPDAPYTYIWQKQWDEFEKECGRGR